jgi:ubiquitin C-terminal hydrolase
MNQYMNQKSDTYEKSPSKRRSRYELCGLVLHSGTTSLKSGHYISE